MMGVLPDHLRTGSEDISIVDESSGYGSFSSHLNYGQPWKLMCLEIFSTEKSCFSVWQTTS